MPSMHELVNAIYVLVIAVIASISFGVLIIMFQFAVLIQSVRGNRSKT